MALNPRESFSDWEQETAPFLLAFLVAAIKSLALVYAAGIILSIWRLVSDSRIVSELFNVAGWIWLAGCGGGVLLFVLFVAEGILWRLWVKGRGA